MSMITRSRPSPAMVVAVVALSFALVGSAVAGTGALDRALTKSKVRAIAKKQANKVLNQRESGLNVNSAKTANSATNATNATNAVNAVNGAPRAFARVLGAGGVDEARTKGLTDASVTVVGSVYCFELGFTPRQVQATVDWFGGLGNTTIHATVNPPNSFGTCPAGHDASARMVDPGGTTQNLDFYISFDE